MDGLTFPVIFGAGVLSFLSPCVLPLVPPYLTYMSGASFEQLRDDGATHGALWRRSVITSLFFILGFSIVFVTLGATATAFGQAFRRRSGFRSGFMARLIPDRIPQCTGATIPRERGAPNRPCRGPAWLK